MGEEEEATQDTQRQASDIEQPAAAILEGEVADTRQEDTNRCDVLPSASVPAVVPDPAENTEAQSPVPELHDVMKGVKGVSQEEPAAENVASETAAVTGVVATSGATVETVAAGDSPEGGAPNTICDMLNKESKPAPTEDQLQASEGVEQDLVPEPEGEIELSKQPDVPGTADVAQKVPAADMQGELTQETGGPPLAAECLDIPKTTVPWKEEEATQDTQKQVPDIQQPAAAVIEGEEMAGEHLSADGRREATPCYVPSSASAPAVVPDEITQVADKKFPADAPRETADEAAKPDQKLAIEVPAAQTPVVDSVGDVPLEG